MSSESSQIPADSLTTVPGGRSIAHVLAPAPFGGLERVVHALAVGQVARGDTVLVIAVVDPGFGDHPVVEGLRAAGVPTTALEVPGRGYLLERRRTEALCRDRGIQVIHTHGYRPDVVDSGVARQLGIPRVTTVHGFTGDGWRGRFYEWLQQRVYRRFQAVVAVSTPIRDRLISSGVAPGRIHVVPNAWSGASTPLPRREARQALGLPQTGAVVGWVGRISAEKGLDVLVESLPHIAGAPTVCVVGDGPLRGAVARHAAELGVSRQIVWAGAVPDAGRLFAAFDVFALSSRTEGTPIALFEAMAAGVPVVATTVGGVPDVVTPVEALLVPSEQPEPLAAAITRAFADATASAARAHAARRRLGERYAPQPWVAAYDRVYDAATEACRL